MNDKEDKIFLAFAAVIVLLIPAVLSYMIDDQVNDGVKKCDQQRGLVVKTPSGWQCIDAKVLL